MCAIMARFANSVLCCVAATNTGATCNLSPKVVCFKHRYRYRDMKACYITGSIYMLDDRKFASVLCCVAALRPVHHAIPAPQLL